MYPGSSRSVAVPLTGASGSLRLDSVERVDVRDRGAVDSDRAVGDDFAARIHRDDGAPDDVHRDTVLGPVWSKRAATLIVSGHEYSIRCRAGVPRRVCAWRSRRDCGFRRTGVPQRTPQFHCVELRRKRRVSTSAAGILGRLSRVAATRCRRSLSKPVGRSLTWSCATASERHSPALRSTSQGSCGLRSKMD